MGVIGGVLWFLGLICMLYGLAALIGIVTGNIDNCSIFLKSIPVPRVVIVICIVGIAAFNIYHMTLVKSLNPSVWVRTPGEYCYTVILENSKGKEYECPAKITVTTEEHHVEDSNGNDDVVYDKVFFITDVYKDDNTVHFEDFKIQEGNEGEQFLDVRDTKNKKWRVTFINKPNYTGNFTESSKLPGTLDLILEIIEIVLLVFAIIGSIIYTQLKVEYDEAERELVGGALKEIGELVLSFLGLAVFAAIIYYIWTLFH